MRAVMLLNVPTWQIKTYNLMLYPNFSWNHIDSWRSGAWGTLVSNFPMARSSRYRPAKWPWSWKHWKKSVPVNGGELLSSFLQGHKLHCYIPWLLVKNKNNSAPWGSYPLEEIYWRIRCKMRTRVSSNITEIATPWQSVSHWQLLPLLQDKRPDSPAAVWPP